MMTKKRLEYLTMATELKAINTKRPILCSFLILIFLICDVTSAQALLLTPYLDIGKTQEARTISVVNISTVSPDLQEKSHSGFITVNKQIGNHLFFWLFRCLKNSSAPLLVWLGGDPSTSSMVGLLYENGPIQICRSDEVCQYKVRNSTWTNHFSMLYIDIPVGVGYSYTDSETLSEKLARQNVSEDLYSFMEQFYQLFPEYRSVELYLGGQSYAGKYVTLFSHHVHTQKQSKVLGIPPLAGIYLGGPLFDSSSQMSAYFRYLYTMGALSYQQLVDYEAKFERYFANVVYSEDMYLMINEMFNSIGMVGYYNYVRQEGVDHNTIRSILTSEGFRKAIHVGERPFQSLTNGQGDKLGDDLLVNVKLELATILDHYKVLIYSGDMDVSVSPPMVERVLLTTPWSLQTEYNRTSRLAWGFPTDLSELRGFFSRTGNFCRVTVRGAGHLTSHDQPLAALDMMQQFVQFGCVQTVVKTKNKLGNLWKTLDNCNSNDGIK